MLSTNLGILWTHYLIHVCSVTSQYLSPTHLQLQRPKQKKIWHVVELKVAFWVIYTRSPQSKYSSRIFFQKTLQPSTQAPLHANWRSPQSPRKWYPPASQISQRQRRPPQNLRPAPAGWSPVTSWRWRWLTGEPVNHQINKPYMYL